MSPALLNFKTTFKEGFFFRQIKNQKHKAERTEQLCRKSIESITAAGRNSFFCCWGALPLYLSNSLRNSLLMFTWSYVLCKLFCWTVDNWSELYSKAVNTLNLTWDLESINTAGTEAGNIWHTSVVRRVPTRPPTHHTHPHFTVHSNAKRGIAQPKPARQIGNNSSDSHKRFSSVRLPGIGNTDDYLWIRLNIVNLSITCIQSSSRYNTKEQLLMPRF